MTLADVQKYDQSQTVELGDRAVVIGAGVAGLCTARMLADYFEQVTLLERDDPPDSPRPRRGVPQGRHAHGLLREGAEILDDVLPGYGDDVVANGGTKHDLGRDWTTYLFFGYLAEPSTSLPLYCASRPLFEMVLRRRVCELEAVEIRSSIHHLGYRTDEGGEEVTGATVRNANGEEETLAAELIVDAAGRASRTPRWLEDHGFSAPENQEVHVDLAYSTGFVERPTGADTAIRVGPHEKGREAYVLPIENDEWIVTLIGRGGDHPPTEPGELRSFAESLAAPDVSRVIETRGWASDEIAHYPFPSNRRYRYESLARFPDGLLVIGDGIASYNPAYGQGMSVAALESLVLHHVLATTGLDDLGPRFFERVQPVIDAAWFVAVSLDDSFPGTTGPIPRGSEAFQEYLAHLLPVAHRDGEVAEALWRVIELEKPPSSLLNPSVVRRVFDGTDDATGTEEAPSWAPPLVRDVAPLLDEHLTDPTEIRYWPGFSVSSTSRGRR